MWRRSERLERDYMTFTLHRMRQLEISLYVSSTNEWARKETKGLLKLITEFTLCNAQSIMKKNMKTFFFSMNILSVRDIRIINKFILTLIIDQWRIYCELEIEEKSKGIATYKHLVVVLSFFSSEGWWLNILFQVQTHVDMLMDHRKKKFNRTSVLKPSLKNRGEENFLPSKKNSKF